MIVLNELIWRPGGGRLLRLLELWPDDIAVVSGRPMREGSEVRTIDGRVFNVAEDVSEVLAILESGECNGSELA